MLADLSLRSDVWGDRSTLLSRTKVLSNTISQTHGSRITRVASNIAIQVDLTVTRCSDFALRPLISIDYLLVVAHIGGEILIAFVIALCGIFSEDVR